MFFQTIFRTFYPSYKQIYSSRDQLKINSFEYYSTVYEWLKIVMCNTGETDLELGGREREYKINNKNLGLELLVYAYTCYRHIILQFGI
jgi:hypothetical protein